MTTMTSTPPSLKLNQFPKRKGWYWVPVEWILQNTTQSVDFGTLHEGHSWEYMMKKKCSDTGFMHLVRSIQENGWMSAIGWYEGEITEGHHRLFAAILLCEPEVPCTEWSTHWPPKGAPRDRISAHGNDDDPDGLDL